MTTPIHLPGEQRGAFAPHCCHSTATKPFEPTASCSWFLVLVALAWMLPFPTPAAETQRRPNILLILADDLGWKDVGYQGSDFCETPNIDRLAKEGTMFTAAYAAAGNCAPSRACLLSGNYTPRHGVYAVGDTKRGPVNRMRLERSPTRAAWKT